MTEEGIEGGKREVAPVKISSLNARNRITHAPGMYRRVFSLLRLLHLVGHAFSANSSTPDEQTTSQTAYIIRKAGVNATFDYVVIGGGTAGLTIATRLAEKAGSSVAVIEAGGFYEQDDGNLSVVPGYSGAFDGTTPGVCVNLLVDWNFTTTP